MNKTDNLVHLGKAKIVDVRTESEYNQGHLAGSINIPFPELKDRLNELKAMGKVVLCSAFGNRSSQATIYLKQQGLDCENAGSWLDIHPNL
jgi:rhodanese-related sulfurtransferase